MQISLGHIKHSRNINIRIRSKKHVSEKKITLKTNCIKLHSSASQTKQKYVY